MSATVSEPLYRINASLLNEFSQRNNIVLIVAKVIKLNGEEILLDANGQCNGISTSPSIILTPGKTYEFLAKISNDKVIRIIEAVDFGDNIDLAMVDKVIEISRKNPDIF